MSIGVDVKDTLADIGQAFTIHKRGLASITGEFLDLLTFPEHSTEFVRNFFGSATLSYDTQTAIGDILETVDGRKWAVTNLHPDNLEGAITNYDCTLYKTNVVLKVQRKASTPVRNSQLQLVTPWEDKELLVDAVLNDDFFKSYVTQDQNFTVDEIRKGIFVTASLDIQQGDRIWISDDEIYLVELVETNRYEGMHVVHLAEDTRE